MKGLFPPERHEPTLSRIAAPDVGRNLNLGDVSYLAGGARPIDGSRQSDLRRPFFVPRPNVVAVQDQRVGLVCSAIRAPQQEAVCRHPAPGGRR